MGQISRSDKISIDNFRNLVRYVTSPVHMILCIGTKGIFVEYFPKQRKVMIGNSRREFKLPKNDFNVLLLFFDTLYDNVKDIVLGDYDIEEDDINVGYIDRENKIYILDLTELPMNVFKLLANMSDRDDVDDYIDLYNVIKLSAKSFMSYIESMYDGF